jgi:radical SAM protein with 4Fe4S-binding SPASM domain
MIHYLTFLSKLTAKKIGNFLLIEISLLISKIFKKPIIWGFPYTVTIEPTVLCNLKCPECHTGAGMTRRKNQSIDHELYREIIDEIKSTTLYLILYFQGEPLMNNNIFDMIKYASINKIYTVTSTNGQHITRENAERIIGSGLDRLIISVDGTDQETYEKYRRGGSLNKLLEGTRILSDLQKKSSAEKPEIIFQFLVFRHNEGQVEEIKKLGKKTGADRVWIKSAQVIHPNEGTDLIPVNQKYSRYKTDGKGVLNLKGHLRNRCRRLWRTTVITTDGLVVPCCFDKNGEYVMGDIKEHNLTDIWKNQNYMNFRTRLFIDRSSIEICNNCTEGVRVYI